MVSEEFDGFAIFCAIIVLMILQIYFKPFVGAKATEIDKKIREYETELEYWKWWTELYPKKKVAAYWLSLNGYEFEKSLAEVFSANGFETYLTPKSNDGGVDIILRNKNNDEIYVQCKAMHYHEAAAFYTYGTYFTRSAHSMRLNPDSGRPFKAFPFDSIER